MIPDTVSDWVHVDCLVVAHLLLEAKLRSGPKSNCAGEVFSITGGQAVRDGAFFAAVKQESAKILGRSIPNSRLPLRLVYLLALGLDFLFYIYPGDVVKLLGPDLGILNTVTLNASTVINPTHSDKAARLLGYRPPFGLLTAIQKTLHEFKNQRIMMDEMV